MDIKQKLEVLRGACLNHELVGSRVTCDPAPTNTDQDVLVLTDLDLFENHLKPRLVEYDFENDGSDCGDISEYLGEDELTFQSFSHGDLNLIVTFSDQFYRRFLAATSIAKMLNLMSKGQRIALFQAVLYGNAFIPLPDLPAPAAPWAAESFIPY
ncbi:hypothetical protein KDX38_10820 [Pseudomonas sp. CDFA 602]|uniref:hypothetical protein n=1 Tax=Pseudomonas californiensis TaxID=2829823 RepID=UPI001E4CB24A|nr:hypothetical protein [Pseudomonas californiensis]MCD5994191.1 hypothetical protein [Pseudomonas californiensis]MCD5999710.1 hypothetical protein [Pseudomonas californiensis]